MMKKASLLNSRNASTESKSLKKSDNNLMSRSNSKKDLSKSKNTPYKTWDTALNDSSDLKNIQGDQLKKNLLQALENAVDAYECEIPILETDKLYFIELLAIKKRNLEDILSKFFYELFNNISNEYGNRIKKINMKMKEITDFKAKNELSDINELQSNFN